jgi:DNA-binding Lrp family transcriptional regulator
MVSSAPSNAWRLRTLTSPLDPLDARLIAALRARPRAGVSELARAVQVARGTAQSRLAKLEARGVITGFGPEIGLRAAGYPVLAFVSLEIVQGRLPEAIAWLREVPEVLEAHGTSGPRDLLLRVVAQDTDALQEVLNRILATPAVRRSTSSIALSELIAYRTAPLVAVAGDRAGS